MENIKAKHGVLDEDTYDFDASGFMTGIILTEAIGTGSRYRGWPNAVQQDNRERTSIIQGIDAKGWIIPPFIFFGKKNFSSWYKEPSIPDDWYINTLENGWSNSGLGLKWSNI